MDYYKDTLDKILKLLKENKENEVKDIIEEELKAPYLPIEFENNIKDIYSKLNISQISKKTLSYEEIEEYLFSTYEKQLIAVDALNNYNLRDYIELINKYLTSDGFINAKVLLIDSLIKQEISEEITYTSFGIDYKFIPRFIIPIEKSDGYLYALEYLKNYYMKEPSKYLMAKDLVYKDALMYLPLNLDEDEGELAALEVINYIDKAF